MRAQKRAPAGYATILLTSSVGSFVLTNGSLAYTASKVRGAGALLPWGGLPLMPHVSLPPCASSQAGDG